MKVDKSLEEVREWKREIYEEEKNLTPKECLEKIAKESDDILSNYGIKLETVKSDTTTDKIA